MAKDAPSPSSGSTVLSMPRWENVRPILVAVYELIDESPQWAADGNDLAAALGVNDVDDRARLYRDLWSLDEAGYIDANFAMGGRLPRRIQGTHEGRQEVQGWPGSRTGQANAELLVTLLRERAEADDTPPEQKTKLRAIVDAIGKGGTDALSKVTAELILRAGGQIT